MGNEPAPSVRGHASRGILTATTTGHEPEAGSQGAPAEARYPEHPETRATSAILWTTGSMPGAEDHDKHAGHSVAMFRDKFWDLARAHGPDA